MGFKNYEYSVSNLKAGEIELHKNVEINGKKSLVLFIKKGKKASVKLFYTNAKKNTVDNSTKMKWIFAAKGEADKWDNIGWKGEYPVTKLANGNSYEYVTGTISIEGYPTWHVGKIYWLEPFFEQPEFVEGNNPKGVYVVFFDEPQIVKGGFSLTQDCIEFPQKELATEAPISGYGQTINLYLECHRLPDTLTQGYNFGEFAITIYSKETKQAVSEKAIYYQNVETDPLTLRSLVTIQIPVMAEWRDKVNHKPKELKGFYAIIEPAFRFNTNAILKKELPEEPSTHKDGKTQPIGWHFPKEGDIVEKAIEIESPNHQLVIVKYHIIQLGTVEQEVYMGQSVQGNQDKFAKKIATDFYRKALATFTTPYYFYTNYQKQEDILEAKKIAISITQQMVKIMDKQYKAASNLPCKYKAIKFTEGERKDKPVFEEQINGTVIDNTDIPWGIVAGDGKRKTVTIKVDGLKTDKCLLLSSNPKLAHNVSNNVFAIGKYDGVQQLIENTDYKIEGNRISLFLKYEYIRTFDADIDFMPDELIDWAWVFKYFILSQDLAIPYFVPINSCAYPNQVVVLKVYPDIKWNVYVVISFAQPQSYSSKNMGSRLDEVHKGKAVKAGIYRGKLNDAIETEKISKELLKKGCTIEVRIKTTVNDQPKEVGKKFEKKLNSFLSTFIEIKKFVDKVSGAEKCSSNQAQNAMKTVNAKAIPVFIQFDYPSIKIDGGWRFDTPTLDGNVKTIGTISFGFSPLIKAKGGIDLIAAARKFPIVETVMTALEIIEWWTNIYLDLVFNIYAFGQIDFMGIIDFYNPKEIKLESKLKLGLGVELAVKAGLTTKKVEFSGNNVGVSTTKGTPALDLSASVESYVEVTGTLAVDSKGIYIQPKANFGGVAIKVVVKAGDGAGSQYGPWQVVDAKPDFMGKIDKIYILQ